MGMRRTCEDSVRDRLREIESELIEIAVGASMPSEREIAAALLLEAQRIERMTSGRVDVISSPQAR
jgi:hypothetical protein